MIKERPSHSTSNLLVKNNIHSEEEDEVKIYWGHSFKTRKIHELYHTRRNKLREN